MAIAAEVDLACAAPRKRDSVSVSSRVILWRDYQPSPFLRTLVYGFDYVDEFLLVFQHPIQLVVVSCTEVAHHVFVAEEEHQGDRIVEFVHLFEVGYLIKIANIDDGEVFDSVGNLIEDFILSHAIWIPITTKTNYYKAFVFGENSLVNMPGGDEMRNDDGAHVGDEMLEEPVERSDQNHDIVEVGTEVSWCVEQ